MHYLALAHFPPPLLCRHISTLHPSQGVPSLELPHHYLCRTHLPSVLLPTVSCHPMILCCTLKLPLSQVLALTVFCLHRVGLLHIEVHKSPLVLLHHKHLHPLQHATYHLSLTCCPHSCRISPLSSTIPLYFLLHLLNRHSPKKEPSPGKTV